MKKLLVIIMMLGVASCVKDDQESKTVNIEHNDKIYSVGGNTMISSFAAQEVTIDGCQYLYISKSNGIVLTHKGYCSNSIHMHQ
jgi:hypothetical protein